MSSCQGADHHYLLFGDNILETKKALEDVDEFCGDKGELFDDINVVGCPSLPIYEFYYNGEKIRVDCKGNYGEQEKLPEEVSNYISVFDKPDIVLYSKDKEEVILASEFTETVSVGNSIWQRAGRAIAARILDIPFLMSMPAVAEDRSQDTLRQPPSLLTEFFLKLSLEDLSSPSLLLLRDDPYVDCYNKQRENQGLEKINRPSEDKYIGKWIGLRLVQTIDSSVNEDLRNLEEEIFDFMFDTLHEKVKKFNEEHLRVNWDLPYWTEALGDPKSINDIEKHTLRDICKEKWNGISGKIASSSYFNKEVVPKIKNLSIETVLKTYTGGRARTGKHCYAEKKFTDKIEEVLFDHYPPHEDHNWNLSLLDHDLPTVFIPLQIWKNVNSGIGYSDPNSGEASAFSALFSTLKNCGKDVNIVFVGYGEPTDNWLNEYENTSYTVWRAIKFFGDLLCIDNGNKDNPVSLKVDKNGEK